MIFTVCRCGVLSTILLGTPQIDVTCHASNFKRHFSVVVLVAVALGVMDVENVTL